jgi:tRNA(fMet)-specific endonuclease VapC
MYLLDTDTVIYILKGHPIVEQNLQEHPDKPMKLCVITMMELYYGAFKSKSVTSNLAKIKTLENALEILPVGREVMEIFGMEKAELERHGTPLDDFDLVLGCCALAHNLTLVTNNVKHFKRIESLKAVNWTEKSG